MTKESTPLEHFKFLVEDGYIKLQNYQEDEEALDSINIIEKALKDKELQDIIINEIKDLFTFGVIDTKVEPKDNGDINLIPNIVYQITREIDNKKKEIIRNFILKQCFPKELKALEIIKEEGFIDLQLLRKLHLITQEKYDLLKEVLCNE